jgi:hypothetical protein
MSLGRLAKSLSTAATEHDAPGEHEQRTQRAKGTPSNGTAQREPPLEQPFDEQRPQSKTERTVANDPDDHEPANCGSSAEVAHATARGAPRRRAGSPRGACVVRSRSTRRQPPGSARAIMPRYHPPHEPVGSKAPAAHPTARPRWLECCTSNIEPPSSAVDFARGALKRRKHRIRGPVISSRRLSSSDSSVRVGAALGSGSSPRGRRNTNGSSQYRNSQHRNSQHREQPPAEVGVGKLTRRRQGAQRKGTAIESQQKFSAEPLIDAAAASVAPGHISR